MVFPVIQRLDNHNEAVFFADLGAGLEVIDEVGGLVIPLAVDWRIAPARRCPFCSRCVLQTSIAALILVTSRLANGIVFQDKRRLCRIRRRR